MEHMDELDIKRIVKLIIQSISFIVTSTLLVGIVALVYSETMIEPTYRSSVSMYVNNNTKSTMISKSQISGADMQASQMLVETYITIIKSDKLMNEVAVQLDRRYGLKYSAKQILSMISASSVNETEIFKINVTGTNSKHTATIANVIAQVAPDIISEYIEASNVKVIDEAVEGVRVSPNVLRNTVLGLVIGLLYSCGVILLREIFDTRIKSETDLENWFGKPILGVIPEIGNPDNAKNKYYYYYRYRRDYRSYGPENSAKGGKGSGRKEYDEFIKAAENLTNGAQQEK